MKKVPKKKKVLSKVKTPKKNTSSFTDDLFPARSKDTIVRTNMDGSISVVHLKDDDSFFSIVGLATEIWKRIDGKTSLADIKKSVVKKYSPPTELFEKDTKSFISNLEKENLIELRKTPQKEK